MSLTKKIKKRGCFKFRYINDFKIALKARGFYDFNTK